jgi:hypothetical protein
MIYEKWIEIGAPKLGGRSLAQAIHGAAFTRAPSDKRKLMVDRCRRAVERRQAQLRPKPE